MKIITLVSGFMIMICLGAVYSWSVFRKPLEQALNISSFESGMPFVALLAVYSLSMMYTGRFIGRHKHRVLIIIGGLLAALGWFCAGLFMEIYWIVIFYGVLTGAGIGIVYGVVLAAVVERFDKNKGIALGIVLAGFGLSAIITAPVLRHLITEYGTQNTFKIAGMTCFIIIVMLSFFKKNINIVSRDYVKKESVIQNFKKYFKDKNFIILWLSYIFGAFSGLAVISITSPAAQEMSGLTAKEAGYAVGILAVFNGLGRPVFGYIFDRVGYRNAAIFNYSIVIAATLIVFGTGITDKIFFYIAFAMIWFSFGGWLALAPAATSEFFGAENYRKTYGYVFSAYGIAAIAGVLLAGLIKDMTGTFKPTFYILLACSAAGIIINVLKGIKTKSAIFLDRDGTINIDKGHLYKREDLEFIENAVMALKKLQQKYRLFIITNQSGIGDGFFTLDQYRNFNEYFLQTLSKENIAIEGVYFCGHGKSDKCECRKPSPFFIKKIAKEQGINLRNSYMIGDHPYDVEAGKNAGTKTIYLLSGHGVRHVKELKHKPDFMAEDLNEAAHYILM